MQVEADALTAKLRALIPGQTVERSLCSVARPKLRNTHGQSTKCCLKASIALLLYCFTNSLPSLLLTVAGMHAPVHAARPGSRDVIPVMPLLCVCLLCKARSRKRLERLERLDGASCWVGVGLRAAAGPAWWCACARAGAVAGRAPGLHLRARPRPAQSPRSDARAHTTHRSPACTRTRGRSCASLSCAPCWPHRRS